MVRVVEDYRRYYPFLRLYRDDLDRIVDIVTQNCSKVEIEIGKYRPESLAQLDDLHLETLPSFIVRGYLWMDNAKTEMQMLAVHLARAMSDVYVSSAACIPLLGAAAQIDQVLAARAFRPRNALRSGCLTVAGMVCFASIAVLSDLQPWSIRHPTLGTYIWLPIGLVATILTFVWPLIVGVLSIKRFTVISTTYSHAETSFWSRKKDDILVALISGFIGLVVGIFTTLLLVALTKP